MSINPDAVIAILFREGNCKQYVFDDVFEVEAFCRRHPYKNEILRVMAFKDRRTVVTRNMPAGEVGPFLRGIAHAFAYMGNQ